MSQDIERAFIQKLKSSGLSDVHLKELAALAAQFQQSMLRALIDMRARGISGRNGS